MTEYYGSGAPLLFFLLRLPRRNFYCFVYLYPPMKNQSHGLNPTTQQKRICFTTILKMSDDFGGKEAPTFVRSENVSAKNNECSATSFRIWHASSHRFGCVCHPEGMVWRKFTPQTGHDLSIYLQIIYSSSPTVVRGLCKALRI